MVSYLYRRAPCPDFYLLLAVFIKRQDMAMLPRLALNLKSSCIVLRVAGITGMPLQTWPLLL